MKYSKYRWHSSPQKINYGCLLWVQIIYNWYSTLLIVCVVFIQNYDLFLLCVHSIIGPNSRLTGKIWQFINVLQQHMPYSSFMTSIYGVPYRYLKFDQHCVLQLLSCIPHHAILDQYFCCFFQQSTSYLNIPWPMSPHFPRIWNAQHLCKTPNIIASVYMHWHGQHRTVSYQYAFMAQHKL